MGMDVYGKNPTSERGEYFRNNVWRWHPLWEYCQKQHPEIAGKVVYGHTNDGDGLEQDDAKALAIALQRDLENGAYRAYERAYKQKLKELPNERCHDCHGSGQKPTNDLFITGTTCKVCMGSGTLPAFETMFHLDEENIRQFSLFLADCGGFVIL